MPELKTASAFKVRKLKDGSGYQVVMDPQRDAPELLIGDFPNEGGANEWIKKDSVTWLAMRKNQSFT